MAELEDKQADFEGGIGQDEAGVSERRRDSRFDATDSADRTAKKDLRGQIRDSVDKFRDKPEGEPRARRDDGKFAPKDSRPQDRAAAPAASSPDEAAPVPKEGKSSDAPAAQEGSPDKANQRAPAPEALSKEIRAKWDTLPEDVCNEFVRRETDSAKGVQQLKDRYRPLDESLAPYRPELQQRGISEAQAVKQLFDWHRALAGPNKVEAARALMQSHGIDIATLAAGSSGARGGQTDQQPQNPSQAQPPGIPSELQQVVQRFGNLESQFQRSQDEQARSAIAAFAKDRPHFESVRVQMAQILGAGLAQTMEDAYNQAVWANPDTRTAILNEQEAKREADANAAAEKQRADAAAAEEQRKRKDAEERDRARRAGVSPRGTAPTGHVLIHRPKGKSVGETIRAAVREASGSV